MNDHQQLAESKYHLATKQTDTALWRFWVVILDCGLEVYQTPDDPSLDEPIAWLRLKRMCEEQGCKIMGMAFARQDLSQVAQINLSPQADGYYYSRRIRAAMAADPKWAGYTDEAQGFGELRGEHLTIHWVDIKDGRVLTETRSLNRSKKQTGTMGLIRN